MYSFLSRNSPRTGREALKRSMRMSNSRTVAGCAMTLALGVLAIAFSGAAQGGESSVQGRVLDAKGEPLGGLPVLLSGEAATSVAITNSNGEYVFFNLPAGDYSVNPAAETNTEPVEFSIEKNWFSFLRSGDQTRDLGSMKIEALTGQ